MTDPDYYLMKTAQILRENNIDFWLCHGTLLGIVRENRLLPWDSDIDFGIWKDEHSKKKILELFSKESEFIETLVPEETDSLHFTVGDKRVDLNFYTRDNQKAYIRWIAPGNSLDKLILFIYRLLENNVNFIAMIKSKSLINSVTKIIMASFLLLVKLVLSSNLKKQLSKNMKSRINYSGYSYPIELMVFTEIEYAGEILPIPSEPEICLALTYGEDWKTPKKDYVWDKEAKNLLPQNR